MEDKIRGFSPDEVVELYHYLCVYESELKRVENLEIFKTKYPRLNTPLETLMGTLICNECNIETLSYVGIVPMDNLVSMTYTKGSKLLSLLYHLRNSIAHGQIEQDSDYVFIIDYKIDYKSGKSVKRFSARGKVKSSTLFKIIDIINKDINLT